MTVYEWYFIKPKKSQKRLILRRLFLQPQKYMNTVSRRVYQKRFA